jgi:hypothetical protein
MRSSFKMLAVALLAATSFCTFAKAETVLAR